MGAEEQECVDMYTDVCKGHFEGLHGLITEVKEEVALGREETAKAREETQAVSDRLFKTNGKRALITCIEDNKKATKRNEEALKEHKETAPAKTIKKLRVPGVIESEGYNAEGMLKIVLAVTILLYMVGRDLVPSIADKFFKEATTELTSKRGE